jgi:ATP-dependent helicase/DNAse subunit B
MGEHIRNQLAREGFTFPASCVMTLGRFVASLTADVATVSRGAFEIHVEQAIRRKAGPEFEKVAKLPGFRRLVLGVCEELSSAGCNPSRFRQLLDEVDAGEPFGRALVDVFSEVESRLARRGLVMRSERLETAAHRVRALGLSGIDSIYLDGFFQFTRPELELTEALSGHAACTVTLPSWPGAQFSRDYLQKSGFSVAERSGVYRSPKQAIVLAASTMERECEDAARRVLDLTSAGRSFREIGILLRSEEPYVPVLRAVLERFGIPARFYFSEVLTAHPAIRFLQSTVRAMLNEWDHELALEALMCPVSGTSGKAAVYEFEFAVREQLPGKGLDGLKPLSAAAPSVARVILFFEQLASLAQGRALPSSWAARLKTLRAFFRGPSPSEPPDFAVVEFWRMQTAALDGFEKAIDEAAEAADEGRAVDFASFWAAVEIILGSTEIRTVDRRRNVVHVLDIYEARQWELPVVIVCGLVEKQFPKYRQRSPLFSDDTRRRWQNAGVHLRTSADWAAEEDFLFELATTRATDVLVLGSPEQNAAGDPLLRSFALDRFVARHAVGTEAAQLIRPAARVASPPRHASAIRDAELLTAIDQRHSSYSPTSIESFLQCPFQFYARKTLRLRERPEKPEQRFSALVQGSILHSVLSRWETGQDVEAVFEEVYSEAAGRERLLPGYRAETVRLELLRALRQFGEKGKLPLDWRAQSERKFEFTLEPGLQVRGRIDRLLIDTQERALVIDFKYSSKANVDKCVKEHDRGLRVQGGLYMLAALSLGLEPAGMVYAGLRKEVTWRGWHSGLPELIELEIEGRSQSALREVMEQARLQAIQAVARIRAGTIAPAPAVSDKCRYCEYAGMCRVEVGAPRTAVAGGAAFDAE